MWSYVICNTLTGDQLEQLPIASCTWGRQLNGTGTGQTVFPLRDRRPQGFGSITKAAIKDLTTKWARTIVKCWNGTPIYGGIIYKRAYDPSTGFLTISHSDFRLLLSRRTTLGTNGYSGMNPYPDGQFPLDSLDYESIVNGLTWVSTIGPTANFELPLFYGSQTIAGPNSRQYWDYNLGFIDDLLTEVTNADGGPDVDYQPVWNDGTLAWSTRTGTDAAPQLVGNLYEFNQMADEPQLFGVTWTDDGSKQASESYAVGAGSERSMLVAVARNASAPIGLTRFTKYTDIDDMALLQGHANADLAAYQNGTIQWALSLWADGNPELGVPSLDQLRLGDRFAVYYRNDEFLDDGWSEAMRVIAITGDQTNKVTVQVQPDGGT